MFSSLVTHHRRSSPDQYGQALVVTKPLKGHVDDQHSFLIAIVVLCAGVDLGGGGGGAPGARAPPLPFIYSCYVIVSWM